MTRGTFKWLGRAVMRRRAVPVVVRESRDGTIELRYRGRLRQWTEIAAPVNLPPLPARPPLSTAPHRPARPRADHPWRRDIWVIHRETARS